MSTTAADNVIPIRAEPAPTGNYCAHCRLAVVAEHLQAALDTGSLLLDQTVVADALREVETVIAQLLE
jgi:hypothetical protein